MGNRNRIKEEKDQSQVSGKGGRAKDILFTSCNFCWSQTLKID